MYDVEFLMSDEYQAFAEKITEISTSKKQSKEEFKKIYSDFTDKQKAFDDEALKLQVALEASSKSHKSTPAKEATRNVQTS